MTQGALGGARRAPAGSQPAASPRPDAAAACRRLDLPEPPQATGRFKSEIVPVETIQKGPDGERAPGKLAALQRRHETQSGGRAARCAHASSAAGTLQTAAHLAAATVLCSATTHLT